MNCKVWYGKFWRNEASKQEYVLVDDVNMNDSSNIFNVLENVYMNHQAEIWSPNGEMAPLIENLGLMHTSMSVGDIIEVVDLHEIYLVSSFGFTKVEDFPSEIKRF